MSHFVASLSCLASSFYIYFNLFFLEFWTRVQYISIIFTLLPPLSFNSFWNTSNIPFSVSWAHLLTPFLFHNSPNPVSSVGIHRHARPSAGVWSAHQGPHPQRKPILPPQLPWIAYSTSARGGGLCVPSPSLLECWRLWRLGLVQAIPVSVNPRVQCSCSVQITLYTSIFPDLWLLWIFCSLFWDVPWALGCKV